MSRARPEQEEVLGVEVKIDIRSRFFYVEANFVDQETYFSHGPVLSIIIRALVGGSAPPILIGTLTLLELRPRVGGELVGIRVGKFLHWEWLEHLLETSMFPSSPLSFDCELNSTALATRGFTAVPPDVPCCIFFRFCTFYY